MNFYELMNLKKVADLLRGLSGRVAYTYSLRQVTEVKLCRVRSNFGWVISEA